MCFNASLVSLLEIIDEIYGADFPAEEFGHPIHFASAFSHPAWPVLKQGETQRFVPAGWGLLPGWAKNDESESIRSNTINARLETLSGRPSFRHLVNRRRCGVLVDGFVEWRHFGGKKYPYFISLPLGRPFLLAGLWDRWEHPQDGGGIETFSVVTTEAQGLMAQVHNSKKRMPVILTKDSGEKWLAPDLGFADIRDDIRPYFTGLRAWSVSPKVSHAREDKNVPGITDPWNYPELPDLVA